MKHILIIEDDKSIAELEKDYLEINGFSCTIAARGTNGLELALSEDFDLVIIDVMLPGMDGFEVIALSLIHIFFSNFSDRAFFSAKSSDSLIYLYAFIVQPPLNFFNNYTIFCLLVQYLTEFLSVITVQFFIITKILPICTKLLYASNLHAYIQIYSAPRHRCSRRITASRR